MKTKKLWIIVAAAVIVAAAAFVLAPRKLTCLDGERPDKNGCCAGEIYTDMKEQGFNCCPENKETSDCFPPIK
ncbi:hypothetical protein FACS18945_2270 [Bacteroidia bacterium]|nr:hypothetical protein FACS18945_2270 [Bacteroidia bacterium]